MTHAPILSILVPTIAGRERQFNGLVAELERQIGDLPVEIVSLCDNKEMSIGEKRQQLYDAAQGKYSVQIDDDDSISPDYVQTVLKYLATEPDCVCYLERVIENGHERIACHSNRFSDWGAHVEGYHYVRTPFFKDIIRTEICKAIPVPNVRFGEDHIWARHLKASGLIRHETFIDKILYFYTTNSMTVTQHKERYGIK